MQFIKLIAFWHRLEIAGAIFMPFWRWCLCEN
nr:MAG TPA: hypothetical protein [Caudoviricetes sp.]